MKQLLLSFLLLSSLKLSAQSTWIERLNYWALDAGQYIYHDSVCGIQNAAVGANGNLFLLGKTTEDDQFSVFELSQNGGAFLSTTTSVGYHSGLSEDVPGSLRATADSGFILFINHSGWASNVYVDSRIEKYSNVGGLQWTRSFKHNPDSDPANDYRPAYDLIQNASGNYYVLIRDSLFELDNSGGVISGSGNVGGKELFELPGGDLLVRGDSTIVRTDLSGNVAWTYSPVHETDRVTFSSSAAFVCEQGTQVTKIDISNGNVAWSVPVSSLPVSSVCATSDGGIIVANGMELRGSAQQSIDAVLTKLDANGSLQWSKTYPLPHYGLSYVQQLPSGNYLTGGTYTACNMMGCVGDYNGFSAVVDSSGDGMLATATYLWPGDADLNDTLAFASDGLLVGIAYGSSGPARDHDNFPAYVESPWDYLKDYASDWSQSFGNGINYKYADFNGDGLIDNSDLNYWIGFGPYWEIGCKESGEAQTNTFPDFSLIPQSSPVSPGDTMRFYIVAGSSATPVNSIYDIASLLSFDYSLIDYSFANVIPYSSDFGTPGTNMFLYANTSMLTGYVISMLISRTDQNDVSQLHDTLGIIELRANATISVPTDFHLNFSAFGAATYNTSPVAFNTIGATVLIDPVATSAGGEENEPQIFPNPASQNFTVRTFYSGEKLVEITDVAGKTLRKIESPEETIRISTNDLECGTYLLRISSEGKETVSKFTIQR